MEGRRLIITSIDDVTRLFKDYCGLVGVPDDAKPLKLFLNPQEQKLGILMESEEWVGPQNPEIVKFEIRRIHAVS